MKQLEPIELLGHAREFDRRTGDVSHRQRRTATRIAVELGQHDAGEWQRGSECMRGVDCVLTLHRVDDEQCLDRIHRGMQLGDLAHHLFIDGKAPGGVDHQHVEVVRACMLQGAFCDRRGLLTNR